MNGATLSHLKLKKNIHERVKEHIDDPLLFKQRHVVNLLLETLMCMMILVDTNRPRMDQVLCYVYKTDDHMEENSPKPNNIDIFPSEGHLVPDITKYYEVGQDLLYSV